MYDQTATTVETALTTSGSKALDPVLINKIVSIVSSNTDTVVHVDQVDVSSGPSTISAGTTELQFVTVGTGTQVTVNNSAPVTVFEGNGVVATFQDTVTSGTRIIVTTAGDDKIIINDNKGTEISLAGGKDTVVAGGGNDTIHAGQSDATIDGGAGKNLVVAHGHTNNYHVSIPGSGQSAADGLPQAIATQHVIVTSDTGVVTDITNVQYVQLDGTDALIFAASTVEAGVAALYHTAFGRTGEFGGIEYWFDKAKAGESLHDIAVEFTRAAEFNPERAMSNSDFITTLYQNTFGRAPDAGGLQYWLNQMSAGASRADLMTQFASVSAMNIEGTLHTEPTLVGSVTIVKNIV